MIYKYLHPDRVGFLNDFFISFTQPKYLNDPSDCLPAFSLSNITKYVDAIVKRNYYAGHLSGYSNRTLKIARDTLVKQYSANPDIVLNMARQKYLDNVNNVIGILCLSKLPDIELLWGYYCDSHKGFVVGFDEQNEFFQKRKYDIDPCGELNDVSYVKTLPTIYVDNLKIDKQMWFTKKDSWSHEKEVRIIRELKNRDKEITVSSKHIYLFKVPELCINEIIFGLQTDPLVISTIKNQIKSNSNLTHIKFKKGSLKTNGQFFIEDL